MSATITDGSAVHTHRIGPTGLVVIRIDRGEIDLRGVSGDTVSVRSLADRSIDRVQVEAGDGSLSITEAPTSEHGRTGAVKLAADVPAGATVVVETQAADLTIVGLDGDQRYRTASGDVVLRDVAGTLSIEAISGDLEVASIDTARLTVRTVSGDVTIDADRVDSLRASTTSGDLRIGAAFVGDGPFAIESVSGDTMLEARGDMRVEAESISGDIGGHRTVRREDSGGRRRLIVGDGGPTVTVRSTSGDLHVGDHRADRSGTDERPNADTRPPSASADPNDDPADLEILRALERGAIDIDEAGRRLAALDADGAHDA